MDNTPQFVKHQSAENLTDTQLAELASGLGHPHRVAIIRHLLEHPGCVCGEIVDSLPVAQSTVSQHLKKLKDSGWIQGSVSGPRTCYRLDAHVVERFRGLFREVSEEYCPGGSD